MRRIARALRLLLAFAALGASAQESGFDLSHAAFDSILRANVNDRGLVNYAAIAADRVPLDEYLAAIAAVPRAAFDSWSREDQLAFLINAYNAYTIQLIVDHFPVASIKDTHPSGDPWRNTTVHLLGSDVTLDAIEQQLIRPVYHEPRIHFALVCAAKSCPPLIPRAYRGDDLDETLERNTRAFLADASRNDLSNPAQPRVSSLFDWYAQDFVDAAGSVQAFISQHSGVTIPPNAALSFMDYDWSLNGR